jgi:hypothetical protein
MRQPLPPNFTHWFRLIFLFGLWIYRGRVIELWPCGWGRPFLAPPLSTADRDKILSTIKREVMSVDSWLRGGFLTSLLSLEQQDADGPVISKVGT